MSTLKITVTILLSLLCWAEIVKSLKGKEKNICYFGDSEEKRDSGESHWCPNKHNNHEENECTYTCCKGWTNYIKGKGCLTAIPCRIALPQKSSKRCKTKRQVEVTKMKYFFKLTNPPRSGNITEVLHVPILDQTQAVTVGYYSLDKFSAHWVNAFLTIARVARQGIRPAATKIFRSQDFNTSAQYLAVYHFYHSGMLKSLRYPFYKFGYHYKPFTNILVNGGWKLDKYFTQQRLAGANPTAIKRISFSDKIGTNWASLKKRLNPNFKLSKEIKKITGKYLRSSIKNHLVYVEEYPLFGEIEFSQDAMANQYLGQGVMRNDTSPIAIFAVHKDKKGQTDLKVVAIQIDNVKTAAVYTPKDGLNWEIAKAQLQIASNALGQIKDHLLRAHYRITPICVGLNRHLSSHHPLHEILKFHCRGAIVASSVTKNGLLAEQGFFHQLLSIGRKGTHTIINKAFKVMKWNDIGIYDDIKQRGLNNRKALPYFPYRDDGQLISRVLYRFARDFVKAHYRADRDVFRDYELQNLMNELSADGKRPPDNGKGRIKGLPSKLNTRHQLAKFLKEIIWLCVYHSAINFPNGDYGAVPNLPSKLYLDPRAVDKNTFTYMLPGAANAIFQTDMSSRLSYLHYDKLLDYGRHLQSSKSRKVVSKYFRELMYVIRPILDKRNAKRYARKQLTYPYFVPDYIPNGPST